MLGGPAGSGPTPLSGIQSEADFHCHLPIRNLVILEVAAHLGDLNHFIFRIVLPARVIALLTASSMPFGEEPTSSIFL
jgi:hypothetical protein